MIKECLEAIKGLLRARVENPTAGPDGANASCTGFRQQGRRVGGQMWVIVRHFGSSSFGVFDKRHRFAGVDTTECACVPEVIARPRLSLAAPRGSGFVYGITNQFPLFKRGPHDRAAIDFTPPFLTQGAPRRQSLVQGNGCQGQVRVAASTKLPEGRRTKTRDMSRGSYFTRSRRSVRPTSALSAGDQ